MALLHINLMQSSLAKHSLTLMTSLRWLTLRGWSMHNTLMLVLHRLSRNARDSVAQILDRKDKWVQPLRRHLAVFDVTERKDRLAAANKKAEEARQAEIEEQEKEEEFNLNAAYAALNANNDDAHMD